MKHNYKRFKELAFSKGMRDQEANRSLVWRANRSIGIFEGYAFYKLGFNANWISMLRCILAVAGGFLLFSHSDSWQLAGVGLVLLLWQVNLDFADGSLARVGGGGTMLGEIADGLGNQLARIIMIYYVICDAFGQKAAWLAIVVIFFAHVVHLQLARCCRERMQADNLVARWLLEYYNGLQGVLLMNCLVPLVYYAFVALRWNPEPLSVLVALMYCFGALLGFVVFLEQRVFWKN